MQIYIFNAFYLCILNVFYIFFKTRYFNAWDEPTLPERLAFIDETNKNFVVDVDRQYVHFDLTYYNGINSTENYCLAYFYDNISSSRKLCQYYSCTNTVKNPDIAIFITTFKQESNFSSKTLPNSNFFIFVSY